MRAITFLCLCLFSLAALAADSYQTALRLYQAGAPRLALLHLERDQGPQSAQSAWYDWESLRLTLLSETQQASEIVARFQLYPAAAPRDFMQKALGHQVWALLESNQNLEARLALARLIWQFDLNPGDLQWARRLVIRSYLQDHKAAEAYRAMLRYQQDYLPLPKIVATEFVQGLLAEDAVTEATTWFASVDAASPTMLELQLKSGLITPEAAMLQARAALQKNQNPSAYTAIIAEAAALQKDGRQQISALEQWLNLAKAGVKNSGYLSRLWQAYQQEAERLGNRAQVLRGDDQAWLALVANSTDDRLGARAVYAYLAQHGLTPQVRELAQAQLYAALVNAQLEGAAVHLFNTAPWRTTALSEADLQRLLSTLTADLPNAATRHLLFTAGRLLESRKQALAAADYFAQTVLNSDLRVPDALTLMALQRARSNLAQAGYPEEADLFYQRIVAQTAPPKKSIPSQTKRKK